MANCRKLEYITAFFNPVYFHHTYHYQPHSLLSITFLRLFFRFIRKMGKIFDWKKTRWKIKYATLQVYSRNEQLWTKKGQRHIFLTNWLVFDNFMSISRLYFTFYTSKHVDSFLMHYCNSLDVSHFSDQLLKNEIF